MVEREPFKLEVVGSSPTGRTKAVSPQQARGPGDGARDRMVMRSRRGASFRLLSEVGRRRFEIALSVPLVLEYEDALVRHAAATGLSRLG